MESIAVKRAKVMKHLIKFMNLIDPSGDNAKAYKQKFEKMSDAEFDKYMKDFLADDKKNFYVEIIEFDRDIKIENVEKCAEAFKVPLFERVAMPYLTGDTEHAPMTPSPVAVGYIHEKRMQQALMKKNTGSITADKRDPKTGQVIGEDKNARISDAETYALLAIGAENALREFMGPRADNMVTKSQMNNAINRNGYVSLEELDHNPENNISLNTLDVYFAMQGIRTNLVVSDKFLPGV
jgi:hypothetical protein